MAGADTLARRIRVTGRVQGVGFRAWTAGEARRLGLGGWVRNADDGSVEALLAGSPEAVSAMIDALRLGPPAARVAQVETMPAQQEKMQEAFRILR